MTVYCLNQLSIFVKVNIFNPNTSFTSDFYEAGRFKLAWRLSLGFALIFCCLASLFAFIAIQGFIIYLTVCLLSIGSLAYLHKTKKSNSIFWLFTISASILVTYSMNTIIHTFHYSDIVWIMCIILFAFIGLSYRTAFFFVGLHIMGLTYYIYFGLNNHVQAVTQRSEIELIVVIIEISFAFLVMSYLIYENVRYHKYIWAELQETNIQLASKNKENITLLKEVHHRVKNNLQIVVSLLRIQNMETHSEETKEHFQSAINRIMTISMIHQKLYQSGELSEIEFHKYINTLVDDIKELHSDNRDIEIDLVSEIKEVDLNSIVPLGLIINELITNSIKHAFRNSNQKTISIKFSFNKNGNNLLEYSDSGQWQESKKNGFGIELLELLTDQLDGSIKRNGSSFKIEFPPAKS